MKDYSLKIARFLLKTLNKTEEDDLRKWRGISKENDSFVTLLHSFWNHQAEEEKSDGLAAASERLMARLNTHQKEPVRRTILSVLTRVAAIFILTISVSGVSIFIASKMGFFSQPQLEVSSESKSIMQDIFVPKGQINQLFLADGTRIWINSETHLVAPSVFSGNERVIQLSGEAFFEVAKDKNRPFRVEVNGQQIEVLGTSFNVRAYNNSNKIETTLETGQIKLQAGSQTVFLSPGEQSQYDRTTHQLAVYNVDTPLFSSWKNGRFEFQNEDLLEVFKVIERWYDIEIQVDKANFKGMHFTGVIKRNKDAHHFFELLSQTIPMKYVINRDKVQITRK